MHAYVCVCVCVCVRVCVRACVRACVCVCDHQVFRVPDLIFSLTSVSVLFLCQTFFLCQIFLCQTFFFVRPFCVRLPQGASALLTEVLGGLAYVSSEEAVLHCCEPPAIDLSVPQADRPALSCCNQGGDKSCRSAFRKIRPDGRKTQGKRRDTSSV